MPVLCSQKLATFPKKVVKLIASGMFKTGQYQARQSELSQQAIIAVLQKGTPQRAQLFSECCSDARADLKQVNTKLAKCRRSCAFIDIPNATHH